MLTVYHCLKPKALRLSLSLLAGSYFPELSVEETGKRLLKALEPPAVPLPGLLTLQYLLRHLDRVGQSSPHNGLDPHTLALLFSPLLLPAGSVSHLKKYLCRYGGVVQPIDTEGKGERNTGQPIDTEKEILASQ